MIREKKTFVFLVFRTTESPAFIDPAPENGSDTITRTAVFAYNAQEAMVTLHNCMQSDDNFLGFRLVEVMDLVDSSTQTETDE